MSRRICMTVSAALIAATATAQESPFVGNWSGVWDNKTVQHNELNVLAVDAEGRVTALYCAQRQDGSGFFFHVKPGGIESSIDGQVLRFNRPKLKMKYKLHPGRGRQADVQVHAQGEDGDAEDVAARAVGLCRWYRTADARVAGTAIHRTRRHHYPHPRPRDVHRSPRSAEAISAIRNASISPSTRTVTSRASIETDPIGPGPFALSTSSAANAGCGSESTIAGGADDATASSPWRAALRHVDNCQRETP